MYKCPKCGTEMVYDTNRCLICPKCDKEYWDRETGKKSFSPFVRDVRTAFMQIKQGKCKYYMGRFKG